MTVVLIFVMIFQAMTLAGVLTLMEEKDRKAGEKNKKHVYRKMSEPEARRILRDLANEMVITAEETAAIDTALEAEWNNKAEFSEAQLADFIENGQTHRKKGAKNGQV